MRILSLLKPDPFTIALVAVVAAASLLPARGEAVPVLSVATIAGIALLFFLHGARLSREAVIAGMTHWRLHLTVLASTYVLFPVIGLALVHGAPNLMDPMLMLGVLYLCLLPSTVQSSIAFTSIAGGNVAAAVCSASASNILGVFLTPLLVALFMSAGNGTGDISLKAVGSIVGQILVPFVAGQALRPWIGAFVGRHRMLVSLVDRGSILLVVYLAFSEAVAHGLWSQLSIHDLVVMLIVDCVLLALVLIATTYGARLLGFDRADEIAIVFCGSKKTLASGVPMASVLFPAASVGLLVLPLMLFHQIQLMVCAVLARAYAERRARDTGETAGMSS